MYDQDLLTTNLAKCETFFAFIDPSKTEELYDQSQGTLIILFNSFVKRILNTQNLRWENTKNAFHECVLVLI